MLPQPILDRLGAQLTDPAGGLITQDLKLGYMNDAALWITRRFKVLEQDYTFKWVIDERYPYPDDMVQMKRLQYNETPSDRTTWKEIDEKPEHYARAVVRTNYPTAARPHFYWARAGFFQVVPMPTEELIDGGLITCWRTAAKVLDPDTEELELPLHMELDVLDLCRAFSLRDLRRTDEADREFARVESNLSLRVHKIEDRSDDARPQFLPRSGGAGTRRQR